MLVHLGMGSGDEATTFDSYLKALRRDGVPFAARERGGSAGHDLVYRYPHIVELAVALAFRTQGILSRDIVRLLVHHRRRLHVLYREAWEERETGRGRPREVLVDGANKTIAKGLYLDLGLTYVETGNLLHNEPKLLDPLQALRLFLARHELRWPRPPLPISQIAENVVRLAVAAPEIKRGTRRDAFEGKTFHQIVPVVVEESSRCPDTAAKLSIRPALKTPHAARQRPCSTLQTWPSGFVSRRKRCGD